MTERPVPRVDISNLPLGDELGAGGQGRVVTAGGFLISGQWPAALKIYSPDALPELNVGALEEIVRLPRQLSSDNTQWLYENTAWPAVIVENAGAVCGFLMRTVPQKYYFDFHTQSQGTRQKHADLAFLLNSDQYVSNSGITVSDHDRLILLSTLATALSRLHDLDIFVGDLSPKNLLFSLQPPQPSCFILDCDAMRVRGETVLKQVHTPDWEVPDGEPTATAAADSYKFGLLAIRLFARDQSSRDQAPLSALSPELARLTELSQHADPALRPTPQAWIAPLQSAAPSASTTPAASNQPAPPPSRISVSMPTVSVPASPVPAGQKPAAPGPSPRRRGPLIAGGFAALVAVLAGAGIAVHALTHSSAPDSLPAVVPQASTALAGSTQQPSNPPAPSTPTVPTSAGVVAIGSSISGNAQAYAVAQIFNTYFSGINQQDYSQALSVFDPSSPINPQSSSTVSALSNADATTTDSNIELTSVFPSGSGPVTKANITFQSQQSAGYGPARNPGQTCTIWNLTYTLTQPSGSYLIYGAKGTDTGC